MPDLFAPDRAPGIAIADAFARLPLETPERSAWPALAARLPAPRRPTRWPYALAAAAVLALALVSFPRTPTMTPASVATTTGATTTESQQAALMAESARLERLLAAASDDGASSATAAALSLALEDRLHVVDASLESSRDPQQQLSLWQQRVDLLREAASLETSRHYLAAEGRSLDMALVAAY